VGRLGQGTVELWKSEGYNTEELRIFFETDAKRDNIVGKRELPKVENMLTVSGNSFEHLQVPYTSFSSSNVWTANPSRIHTLPNLGNLARGLCLFAICGSHGHETVLIRIPSLAR
jgi:hypothetical protein